MINIAPRPTADGRSRFCFPQEVYQRRILSAFGGGKERRSAAGRSSTVVDLVVGGQVAAFRASELWFAGVVQEMPTDVAELLCWQR